MSLIFPFDIFMSCDCDYDYVIMRVRSQTWEFGGSACYLLLSCTCYFSKIKLFYGKIVKKSKIKLKNELLLESDGGIELQPFKRQYL